MIELQSENGQTLYVIEPGNIDRLKEGRPLLLKENIAIVYTPDANWVVDQLIARQGEKLMIEVLQEVILESLKRPEIHVRPHHPPFSWGIKK